MPYAGFAAVKRLASSQPVENVSDDLRVGMELADVVADIFLGCITEQVQFGLIGPKDFAGEGDLMNSFTRILKEIRELSFAAEQGFFGFQLAGLNWQRQELPPVGGA